MSTELFAQTGLPAILAELREFVSSVKFDRPYLFTLSLIPTAMALLTLLRNRSRVRSFAVLGKESTLHSQIVGRFRSRGGQRLAFALAWPLLILGAAGPRWGPGDDDGVAVGRDIVIVIDLSRSMLAEDMANPPTRWQSAVAAADDLVDTLRRRGGHRAAIVVFAAQAKLVVPLTTDYDHLQAKLRELDGPFPPAETRPTDDSASGTRIGAALVAAVEAHDSRFSGYQDILLLSDGDDPADNPAKEREWGIGVTKALQAKIPVHTVGFGDPDPKRAVPILFDGRFVEFAGKNGIPDQVRTHLHEDTLSAIAEASRGSYLPARTGPANLGNYFRTVIEPNPSRELSDDALPRPRDRPAWFLALGLLLLVFAWFRE